MQGIGEMDGEKFMETSNLQLRFLIVVSTAMEMGCSQMLMYSQQENKRDGESQPPYCWIFTGEKMG